MNSVRRSPTRRSPAALLLPLAVLAVLFEPLFLDRSLLSFDNRQLIRPLCANLSVDEPAGPMNLLTSDINGWIMPETMVQVRRLQRGELPLWNPHTILGQPLLANLAFAPFYPSSILYLWLDPVRAYAVSMALHLLLLGAGMHRLLRDRGLGEAATLLGTLTLTLSGFVGVHLHLPHFVRVAAWLPWILWVLDRQVERPGTGRSAALGACVGLSLLAGFPQLALLQLYAAAALFLVRWVQAGRDRRTLAHTAGALVLGGLLSTVHLLPAMELLGQSFRQGGLDYEQARAKSLEPEVLGGLVLPHLFGDAVQNPEDPPEWGRKSDFPTQRRWLTADVQNNFVENTTYVGLIPLVLAFGCLLSLRRARMVAVAAVGGAGLLVALGVPGVLQLARWLPGVASGSPKRALWLLAFALAWLAAVGLQRLLDRAREPLQARRLLFVGGLLVALSACWSMPFDAWLFPDESDTARLWFRDVLGRDFVRLSALGGAFLLASVLLRRRPQWAAMVLVGATTLDLVALARRANPPQPLGPQYALTDGIRWLQKTSSRSTPPARVASFGSDELLPGTFAAIYDLHAVSGVAAMMIRETGELLHALDPATVDVADARTVRAFHDPAVLGRPLYRLLGAPLLLASERLDESLGLPMLYGNEKELMGVFEVPEVLPFAFSVERTRVVEEREERLRVLADPDFDPAAEVVLEQAFPFAGNLTPVTIEVERPGAEHLVLATRSEGAGFVVVRESWFPGWKATLDDEPLPLLRVDHALMGVVLPPGEHRVELRYQPASFQKGLLGSLIACIALALLAIVSTLRRSPPGFR